MTGMMSYAEFLSRFGPPERLPDRDDGLTVVFAHDSLEAAEVFAQGNREHEGHPTEVRFEDGRWLILLDLRPAMARSEREQYGTKA